MNIKDNLFTGLISGIVAPAIAFVVYTKIKLPTETIMNVIRHIMELGILSTIISISVFINLLVFFVFIWSNAERSARGVLFATFLYAFVVVVLKLVN
jgi:hypothetical protein